MIDSSVMAQVRFNPLAGNEFKTRDDVIKAVHDLFNPLLPAFSKGKARVQLDASAASFDRASADLEGFARPLFGIAPMVAGGTPFDHWDAYREGLKNGTDPSHPEYWGRVLSKEQRQVEMAALGYGLLLVPEHFWDPLDEATKSRVAKYLSESRVTNHHSNNHRFFRVMTDLGLLKIGVKIDESLTEEYLQDLESMYMDDGWYRDGDDPGDNKHIDYYNPYAMHFYGLIYAVYRPEDKARSERFKERARKFAVNYQHWFADDGANVPYGRSMTYRFAVAGFWGALAVANEEALPWGVIKGLYLRNLRWWSTQPISRLDDGILTVGYAYPNQFLAEMYNSTGSPLWAMKAFTPLLLPPDHPFWTAEELSLDHRPAIAPMPVTGMVFCHQPGHTVMFTGGSSISNQMRFMPEKYQKFAYSSRYGFSIESDSRGFGLGAFDSMIAFSDDGRHYRVREDTTDSYLAGDILFAVWYPWPDVKVETWLVPRGAWHIRVHRITSPRNLKTVEGGFAAPRTDFNGDETYTDDTSAWVESKLGDFSGILDASSPKRSARVTTPHGNTNLMFPRTIVPQLQGDVEANRSTVFACAVLASPNQEEAKAAWSQPPAVPTVEELDQLIKSQGVQVDIVKPYVRDRDETTFMLELRYDSEWAQTEKNNNQITFSVDTKASLDEWLQWLRYCGVEHSPIFYGVVGWMLAFKDTDARHIRLYTEEVHPKTDHPDIDPYWLA
ncbi:hypothetical protein BZG36_05441 [Bifiguratus adelaidae]|uniref:DUF2264 domain-containing protein n=1 Tax=Bifiguratus adelaidae TaxID=1938954 RepID=A0A261XTJ9_9FUNG|nr:hypothetical protein BZG36_05441 [Bifiguratus adelaidae]